MVPDCEDLLGGGVMRDEDEAASTSSEVLAFDLPRRFC